MSVPDNTFALWTIRKRDTNEKSEGYKRVFGKTMKKAAGILGQCFKSIAFCLGLFAVLPVFAAADATYEITGTCTSMLFGLNSNATRSIDYKFRVAITHGSWLMHLEDLAVKNGIRQNFDYADTFYDGVDLFRVVHFPESVVAKSRAPDKYQTFGYASTRDFPVESTIVEKALWLIFCSSDYAVFSAGNFPRISDQVTNVTSIEAEYFSSVYRLPRALKAWATGSVVFRSSNARGLRAVEVPSPSPFEKGYLFLELQTEATTNINGTLILPRQTSFTHYSINSTVQPAELFRALQIDVFVTEARESGNPPTAPALPGIAVINDTRYLYDRKARYDDALVEFKPGPVGEIAKNAAIDSKTNLYHALYLETNGAWMSRAQPSLTAALRAKQRPSIHRGTEVVRLSLWAWVTLCLILLPGIVIVKFLANRRNVK